MSSAERPLVSILTPSFNQGRFIQDCIDSVASQTYRPIEHIIMDGGSTDETLSILRQAPDHVRWVSEPDRGQSHALNKALAASSGEIIGWVNSDDAYADRRAVEWAAEVIGSVRDTGVVFGDAFMISSENMILRHLKSHIGGWSHFLPDSSPLVQPAAFIRRTVLERSSCFLREDLSVTMDFELWLRLNKEGTKFTYLPRTLAVDRNHSERKVRTLEAAWAAERELLASEYGVRFGRSRLDRLQRWLLRLSGLKALPIRKDPESGAVHLWTDTKRNLIVRQLFVSHTTLALS